MGRTQQGWPSREAERARRKAEDWADWAGHQTKHETVFVIWHLQHHVLAGWACQHDIVNARSRRPLSTFPTRNETPLQLTAYTNGSHLTAKSSADPQRPERSAKSGILIRITDPPEFSPREENKENCSTEQRVIRGLISRSQDPYQRRRSMAGTVRRYCTATYRIRGPTTTWPARGVSIPSVSSTE